MSGTAWAHLPNAVHIDHIVTLVKVMPEVWPVPCSGGWLKMLDIIDALGRGKAGDTVRTELYCMVRSGLPRFIYGASCGAILALIAYDDCAYMLDSDLKEIKILAALGDPKAGLLLPACIAFAKEKELA